MKIHRYLIGIIIAALAATPIVGCSKTNPLDELEEWDLVYICDSTGWGVPKRYAENIERDTGKTVRVHSYTIGRLSALRVLNFLQNDLEALADGRLKSLQEDIREAEVIVFFANPRGNPSEGGVRGGLENCISASSPPDDCTPGLYEPYLENLKAIYEEISSLRDDKPTIIRAVDFYNPLISVHGERNMEAECTRCLEVFNDTVQQAADAFHIPTISVYDAFNGVNHDEDPREKGYIGGDGVHTSEQGQQVIADILSEAGYEPVEP